MQLGGIKGAFPEAGPINPKLVPLFANQPEGGVPGLDPEDVIDLVGNVYGSNDAPFSWWHTFDAEVCSGNWIKSQLITACTICLNHASLQSSRFFAASWEPTLMIPSQVDPVPHMRRPLQS